MDVNVGARCLRRLSLIVGLSLVAGVPAKADPMYTAIDLGTGSVSFGVDSSGNGTVVGSSGQVYTFNPAQNALPAQWAGTSQGVPTVEQAPAGSPMTYGNPGNAFSYSILSAMNAQGLAAGVDQYGVSGHLGNGEAFLTQRQPDGSWGAPIPLWSGASNFDGSGYGVGIEGVSANGQVLGYGALNPGGTGPTYPVLYLYDTKTQSLTNLTSLVNAKTWTSATQAPGGLLPNWVVSSVTAEIDNQGRILLQATEGLQGSPHNLLLVPQGGPTDLVAAPEPATWVVFASLIGGAIARKRLRPRDRS